MTGLAVRGFLGDDLLANDFIGDAFDERIAAFLAGLLLKRALNDWFFTGVAIVKA
jgi:hypothetical protein